VALRANTLTNPIIQHHICKVNTHIAAARVLIITRRHHPPQHSTIQAVSANLFRNASTTPQELSSPATVLHNHRGTTTSVNECPQYIPRSVPANNTISPFQHPAQRTHPNKRNTVSKAVVVYSLRTQRGEGKKGGGKGTVVIADCGERDYRGRDGG
jgi:hypothetical protein